MDNLRTRLWQSYLLGLSDFISTLLRLINLSSFLVISHIPSHTDKNQLVVNSRYLRRKKIVSIQSTVHCSTSFRYYIGFFSFPRGWNKVIEYYIFLFTAYFRNVISLLFIKVLKNMLLYSFVLVQIALKLKNNVILKSKLIHNFYVIYKNN